MMKSIVFGPRSTADRVLAGIDLTNKRFLVTGCNSGIGLQTMNALAANGAHVIGLARTVRNATHACNHVGFNCTPIGCDLADFDSIAAAVQSVQALQLPLDGIVANAGIANLPRLHTRYGVELQFLVNHLGHFALINGATPLLRNGSRIVVVSSGAALRAAPVGIMFDNLAGERYYKPAAFYAQSKLANVLFAKELARRLKGRGIAVNAADPGVVRSTRLYRHLRLPFKWLLATVRPFMKSAERGAATQALLAASPSVSGISGEFWSNCSIAPSTALMNDEGLARRLWDMSRDLIAAQVAPASRALLQAA